MRVLITGGAGFLGSSLARALLKRGALCGASGSQERLDELVLFDQAPPAQPVAGATCVTGDINSGSDLASAFSGGFDSIFHLAAVVSAAAEADFDLGMAVNFDGARRLLELARGLAAPPKVVFASSVAVFGGEMPAVIRDDTPATPQSSYGTQKEMCELLLNDASRRGFVDARCLRLPTVVVRPGKPNKAASSFASSVIREPLAGQVAVCPVAPETELWLLSPRRVVDAFIHAHELPGSRWGTYRTLNLPGITVTVRDMVAALERAGGDPDLVRWEQDEAIARMVATWPGRLDTARARDLGFEADHSIDEMIGAYVEDYVRG